jgi:xylan 1,4-beta-xylosidase
MRYEFDGPALGPAWNFIRNPYDADRSLTERPGWLRLRGSPVTLSDQDAPAFAGRRRTDFTCRAAARLSFEPHQENEEAGLVIRGNDKNHYELGITLRHGRRQVFVRRILAGNIVELVSYEDAPEGEIILSIVAGSTSYGLFFQSPDGPPVPCGTAKTTDLASEKIGGFTGIYLGVYATGNGQRSTMPADFAWFEYSTHESRANNHSAKDRQ